MLEQIVLDSLQDHARTANPTPTIFMEVKLVFMSEFAFGISNSRCNMENNGALSDSVSPRTQPCCMS